MKQMVVSFSGGRTSAYLCSLIKKLHPNAVFVFMDTGAEHPATYDFVRQCNEKHLREVIDFISKDAAVIQELAA